jgi:hypothetical protein
MNEKNNYFDQIGDFTAPSEGSADYLEKLEHRIIEQGNKKK